MGGCFYEEWHAADETGTVRHFFPWWLEERYREMAVKEQTLTEEERKLVERAGLTLEQIGYRRQVRAGFRRMAAQEYAKDAESCFLASGDCFFEREEVEKRLKDLGEPVERRRNGEVEIWLPPLKGHQYIVALDPAAGLSTGDYSAAQVIDMETGMQCAEMQAHVGGRELAEQVAGLGHEYNEALVVVERNSIGTGPLMMLEEVCRYPDLPAERAGGMADYGGDAAGSAGAAEFDADPGAEPVYEPAAAGGVPDVCAACGWELGGGGGGA